MSKRSLIEDIQREVRHLAQEADILAVDMADDELRHYLWMIRGRACQINETASEMQRRLDKPD